MMGQRVKRGEDGCYYRKRRGKLVAIPAKWVGKTIHPQTRRKRRQVREVRGDLGFDLHFGPKRLRPYYRTHKPPIEED